ncbi:MAG: hypothetical protein B6D68_03130 [spirochete symbiont of Stewartia floridana]|nr:MAG: hypothetical protein B6D68_03130 [spirochete symbiont of Stewartia floridana]
MLRLKDESSLIRRFVEDGDEQAFTTLVHLHLPMLRRIIGAAGARDADSRDEILQEVLIRIHRALPSFRFKASFTTWAYRVARNTALNEFRKSQRRLKREVQQVQDIPDMHNPEQRAMQDAHTAELKALFYKLKEKERQILLLREREGLSMDEIAEILRISPGTVKSRLSRARKQARLLYEGLMK